MSVLPSGLKRTHSTHSLCSVNAARARQLATSNSLTSPYWPNHPPQDASILPSGEKLKQRTWPRAPLIRPCSLPVATLHRTISSSVISPVGRAIVARYWLLGEKARHCTPCAWAFSVRVSLRPAESQKRTVPSKLAVANDLPSGAWTMVRTGPVCSLSVAFFSPVV